MTKNTKCLAIVTCLCLLSGCTANNTRNAVFDFLESSHNNYEKRQVKNTGRLSKSDKNYKKEDAAVGVISAVLNAVFRGVTGQSDDN